MATVVVPLWLKDAEASPSLPFPTPIVETSTGGGVVANSFPFQTLQFNDGYLSAAYWVLMPGIVGTAPAAVTLNIDWYSPAVITGNVVWGFQVAAVAANASTLTKALTNVPNTTPTAVSGTLNGRVRTTITPTPGAATTDNFGVATFPLYVKIFRDGGAATDTALGEVRVVGVSFTYSDT